MLARLFRSDQPAVLLAVPVLVLLLFGAVPWRSTWQPVEPAMPLQAVLQHLLGLSHWVPTVITALLLMVLSVQLQALARSAELFERRGQLPALLFLLLLANLAAAHPLDPALAGMPLVVMGMRRAWSISNTGAALGALFDAGFLLGMAALFYLPYAFLLVVVWASVSVIRPFQWREYLVPFLALMVVFYLAWAVLYLMGSTPWRPLLTVLAALPATQAAAPDAQRVLLYLVLGVMLLVSLWVYAASYQRGVMREKNLRSSFMALLSALLVLMAFSWLLGQAFPPVLLAAPLAMFLAHALVGTQRAWLREAAVYALLLLGLWVQWG